MLCMSVDIYRLFDVFISVAEVHYGHNCNKKDRFREVRFQYSET